VGLPLGDGETLGIGVAVARGVDAGVDLATTVGIGLFLITAEVFGATCLVLGLGVGLGVAGAELLDAVVCAPRTPATCCTTGRLPQCG
jgi:hypothetical protein